jgi:hypothetical protein
MPKAGAIVAKHIGHNKGPDVAFMIERDALVIQPALSTLPSVPRLAGDSGSGPTRLGDRTLLWSNETARSRLHWSYFGLSVERAAF